MAGDVECLTALLRAAVALYTALRACDTDLLEFYGLSGVEDDIFDLREDLEAILGSRDLQREG